MAFNTILIMDEKASLRDLAREYLGAEGFRVVIVADGHEALYIARQEKHDLILPDLMMPEMSGYDFLKTYRKERETPGILLIANSAKLTKSLATNSAKSA